MDVHPSRGPQISPPPAPSNPFFSTQTVCPHFTCPSQLFQSRLESYKTAKESQTTEQIKAALEAKMNKATTKHEDIIKAKVEA